MNSPEEKLVCGLKTTSTVFCTIESCTGGLIASTITDVAGASSVFWGALITYDNSAKESLAEVSPLTLENFGPVSPQTATAMAEGGLKKMMEAISRSTTTSVTSSVNSSVHAPLRFMALSITGVAGPSGGTPQTPVGLAYAAIAISGRATAVRELRADPSWSREKIKAFFADSCLRLALESLASSPT